MSMKERSLTRTESSLWARHLQQSSHSMPTTPSWDRYYRLHFTVEETEAYEVKLVVFQKAQSSEGQEQTQNHEGKEGIKGSREMVSGQDRKQSQIRKTSPDSFLLSSCCKSLLHWHLHTSLPFRLSTTLETSGAPGSCHTLLFLTPSESSCENYHGPDFWPHPADQLVYPQIHSSNSREPELELDFFPLIKFTVYTNSITSSCVLTVAGRAKVTYIHPSPGCREPGPWNYLTLRARRMMGAHQGDW